MTIDPAMQMLSRTSGAILPSEGRQVLIEPR